MVCGDNRYDSVTRSHLVFERVGKGMYLTQAWFAGTNAHVEAVAKPKSDLDYAKQNAPAPSIIEVASK